MSRTSVSAPPRSTTIVSPSTTRTTVALASSPRLGGWRSSHPAPMRATATLIARTAARRRPRSDALDDRAGAEAAATAHRDERVGPIGPLQLVQGLREEERTGASER